MHSLGKFPGATSTLLAVTLFAVTLLASLPAQHTSAQETLAGEIPTGSGVTLVQWSGGPLDTLQTIVEARGCRLRSVWLTTEGAFIGYIPNAPDPVNAEWSAHIGPTPGPGPLLLVCATIGLGECLVSAPIFDYAYPLPSWSTPWEAIQDGIHFVSDLPQGTWVEADVSNTRVTWEIVAKDGTPVATFRTERSESGWYLSSLARCIWP